ncbi:hypothetical protein GTPT_0263 [Tatumella ptyseos ATCC 33301]|uniref:Uncharacterized protein n=1 Tax=Tatumella ptyseos ATCC 33301 TaxID=1005995 RepID=A0A085JQD8_9GAMM|nr:hypothetical protein GTPT_0263 [Tatumella ptyseos ATCC 33301]
MHFSQLFRKAPSGVFDEKKTVIQYDSLTQDSTSIRLTGIVTVIEVGYLLVVN